MLNQDQIIAVWERQLAAETRALYFAELASNYTRQKQWITGASFFLASGAAATLLGKFPAWVPVVLAVITAVLSAYSIARGLDGATRTMAKFQFSWSELAAGYESLWNTTWRDDASTRLDTLISRENELSSQASTEAPNKTDRVAYWQDQVLRQHHLTTA